MTTVTLNLTPDIEDGLRRQARAFGVSLDTYLQEIVNRQAHVPVPFEPSVNKSLELPVLHLGQMEAIHRADLYDDAG